MVVSVTREKLNEVGSATMVVGSQSSVLVKVAVGTMLVTIGFVVGSTVLVGTETTMVVGGRELVKVELGVTTTEELGVTKTEELVGGVGSGVMGD